MKLKLLPAEMLTGDEAEEAVATCSVSAGTIMVCCSEEGVPAGLYDCSGTVLRTDGTTRGLLRAILRGVKAGTVKFQPFDGSPCA